DRRWIRTWEEIDDAAANGELDPVLDLLHPFVSERCQPLDHCVKAETAVTADRDRFRPVARVKAALLEDPIIKSLDISVTTSHGEVQLSGFVDRQTQIDEAQTIARAVPGAVSVKNELMLRK
ncbi:MAG: BON domain-containing protein, partial [Burkholderiaceae bacterium]|nr:BON domain-containing protein [Burkholderiaceae bacterium]